MIGAKSSAAASSASAWMIETSRVCPPDLMPTEVRAMAAVAGTPPKKGNQDVADALRDQLLIGLQADARHLAGHGAAEQRLDRTQRRNRKRGAIRRPEVVPGNVVPASADPPAGSCAESRRWPAHSSRPARQSGVASHNPHQRTRHHFAPARRPNDHQPDHNRRPEPRLPVGRDPAAAKVADQLERRRLGAGVLTPRKLSIWPTKMMTAMPVVKPRDDRRRDKGDKAPQPQQTDHQDQQAAEHTRQSQTPSSP